MRRCTRCHEPVPEGEATCRRCGCVQSPTSPQPTVESPQLVHTEVGQLRARIEVARRDLTVRKSRGRLLLAGVAIVVAILAFVGILSYAKAVLSYAQLEALGFEPDPTNPRAVRVFYTPACPGKLGFLRTSGGRSTEVLDRVHCDAQRPQQEFYWSWREADLRDDHVVVTYRKGLRLTQREWSREAKPLGKGVVEGQVVNAESNRPMAGVEVMIAGTPLKAVSDDQGQFRIINAPTGPQTVVAVATGFVGSEQKETVTEHGSLSLKFAISRTLDKGEIRFVLSWGDEPKDLDAHLTFQSPDGKSMETWWKERRDASRPPFLGLDVDGRTGRGPETITIRRVQPGTYRYSVHDYSNRGTEQSLALARSAAFVRILEGDQERFAFQADGKSVGTHWQVMEMRVKSDRPTFLPVDRYETKVQQTGTLTVALTLDVSGSMNEGGKLEQMKRGASSFLDELPLGAGIKAGIVVFGWTTGVACPLSTGREQLRQALSALRAGGGTPMAEAIRLSTGLLMPQQNTARFIVLFTDGLPDSRPVTLEAATVARRVGIEIWAVGTSGADIGFLQQVASSPDKAFYASPEKLRPIFAQIARDLKAEFYSQP